MPRCLTRAVGSRSRRATAQEESQNLREETMHLFKQFRAAGGSKAQQDKLLAEIRQKREEVSAWAVAEKAAVERWCAQQRAAISKERRAAQRAAQGSTNQPASRKERAEIEALKATIEKMKIGPF